MNNPVIGSYVGKLLCDLWPLPPETFHITIDLPVDGPASVTCKYYLSIEHVETLIKAMQVYTLQEKGSQELLEDAIS